MRLPLVRPNSEHGDAPLNVDEDSARLFPAKTFSLDPGDKLQRELMPNPQAVISKKKYFFR